MNWIKEESWSVGLELKYTPPSSLLEAIENRVRGSVESRKLKTEVPVDKSPAMKDLLSILEVLRLSLAATTLPLGPTNVPNAAPNFAVVSGVISMFERPIIPLLLNTFFCQVSPQTRFTLALEPLSMFFSGQILTFWDTSEPVPSWHPSPMTAPSKTLLLGLSTVFFPTTHPFASASLPMYAKS